MSAVAAPPTGAAFKGANGKIAFESLSNVTSGDLEIFTVNPDGSGSTDVSNNPAQDFQPAFSADGSKIAFVSIRDSPGGGAELYVMNADGSGVRRLTFTTPGEPRFPAWSPDDTKIAYGFQGGVYVINADGSGATRLGPGTHPAWSPDGSKIAFTDTSSVPQTVTVMNADGSNAVKLADGSRPNWSPDGSKIAYEVLGSTADIMVMNANGSGQTRIASGTDPAWSPDGTKIAFLTQGYLNVMNADGSGQKQLVPSFSTSEQGGPDWQPLPSTVPSTATKCVVPKLKGKTLKQANRALKRAHCTLGKVRGPKHRKVNKQSPKPGKVLPAGSKVNVKLG